MKKTQGRSYDIISHLPRSIIETILTYLPIRDAVRTSILSRKWRYSWINLPDLVFDKEMYKGSPQSEELTENKFLLAIFQVLLVHQGPIIGFALLNSALERCSEIDQVILFLSRNAHALKKFIFDISSGNFYTLPKSFFSLLELTDLNLGSCVFKPPPTFEGFSKLISLEFYDVIFAADIFGTLISSCPLVERLSLDCPISFEYLEINAPKLKYIWVRCFLKYVSFANSRFLEVVSIDTRCTPDQVDTELMDISMEGGKDYVIELFGCLPVIKNLHIGYHFIKCLAAGGVPKKLPTTLVHLKNVEILNLSFEELDEVSLVLCLIRSSPNLHEITIQVSKDRYIADSGGTLDLVLAFLEVQDYSDVCMDHLQVVKMELVSGIQPELDIIKLLLTKSPMLEKMLIKPDTMKVGDNGLSMLKEITRFRRLSPRAEIIYED